MRIVTKKRLKEFWEDSKYGDSKKSLMDFIKNVRNAKWKNSNEVKQVYGNCSTVGDNRIVFNICGNKYRFVVHINYVTQIVYVRFIGTHKQYDKIDVKTI